MRELPRGSGKVVSHAASAKGGTFKGFLFENTPQIDLCLKDMGNQATSI